MKQLSRSKMSNNTTLTMEQQWCMKKQMHENAIAVLSQRHVLRALVCCSLVFAQGTLQKSSKNIYTFSVQVPHRLLQPTCWATAVWWHDSLESFWCWYCKPAHLDCLLWSWSLTMQAHLMMLTWQGSSHQLLGAVSSQLPAAVHRSPGLAPHHLSPGCNPSVEIQTAAQLPAIRKQFSGLMMKKTLQGRRRGGKRKLKGRSERRRLETERWKSERQDYKKGYDEEKGDGKQRFEGKDGRQEEKMWSRDYKKRRKKKIEGDDLLHRRRVECRSQIKGSGTARKKRERQAASCVIIHRYSGLRLETYSSLKSKLTEGADHKSLIARQNL